MAGTKDIIQVAFTADGNYAMPLAVALCSTAINCDPNRHIVFNIFFDNFSRALQKKVELSLDRSKAPNAKIIWHQLDLSKVLDCKIVHSYMNHLIYARLLIPHLLSDRISKALYLDSDLVVIGDLSTLWDTDMGQKSLFAVRDRIGTVGGPGGLLNYRDLGIPKDAKYLNSGVLLMNLDKWRARKNSEKIIEYLKEHSEIIQMGDQDGLNAVLFDDWSELEFRWNWQVVPNLSEATKRGSWGLHHTEKSIIHYCTSVKPWRPLCNYEEKAVFLTYLDRTEWSGWRVPYWKECLFAFRRKIGPSLRWGASYFAMRTARLQRRAP